MSGMDLMIWVALLLLVTSLAGLYFAGRAREMKAVYDLVETYELELAYGREVHAELSDPDCARAAEICRDHGWDVRLEETLGVRYAVIGRPQ
jgi:hypothetical protein